MLTRKRSFDHLNSNNVILWWITLIIYVAYGHDDQALPETLQYKLPYYFCEIFQH